MEWEKIGAFICLSIILNHKVNGLSCICGLEPCQTPSCCDSGYYTSSPCGCCLTCARGARETCGGPFRVSGTCAVGLSCQRQCECKTLSNSQCIFPFKYKDVVYNKCTLENSKNGLPWCATGIDDKGVAIEESIEDCNQGCPGTSYECNESYLFNINGRCVNETEVKEIEKTLEIQVPISSFDEGLSSLNSKKAPFCSKTNSKLSEPSCRCSEIQTEEEKKSKHSLIHESSGAKGNEWCFLEFVENHKDPTKNCYSDVKWSSSHGRFWSLEAVKFRLEPTTTT